MIGFKQFLESDFDLEKYLRDEQDRIDQQYHNTSFHPDYLRNASNEDTTFVYLQGHLWHDPKLIHDKIIQQHMPEIQQLLGTNVTGWTRDKLREHLVLGRIAHIHKFKKNFVSFWNANSQLQQIKECVKILLKENLVDQNTIVVVGNTKTPVSEFNKITTATGNWTPEELAAAHTAHPLVKKMILGKTPSNSKDLTPNRIPGRKAWAPHSEAFNPQ